MLIKESPLGTLLSEPAGATERDSPYSVFKMFSTICSVIPGKKNKKIKEKEGYLSNVV